MIVTGYNPKHAASTPTSRDFTNYLRRPVRHAPHRPVGTRMEIACRGTHCAGNTGTDLAVTEARAYYRNGGK